MAPAAEAFLAPALAPRVASGRLHTSLADCTHKRGSGKLRMGRSLRMGLTGGIGESLLDWERERDDEVPPRDNMQWQVSFLVWRACCSAVAPLSRQVSFPLRHCDRCWRGGVALSSRKSPQKDDGMFYDSPRLVYHQDHESLGRLTSLYAQVLPAEGLLVDLMASWTSHLPEKSRCSPATRPAARSLPVLTMCCEPLQIFQGRRSGDEPCGAAIEPTARRVACA